MKLTLELFTTIHKSIRKLLRWGGQGVHTVAVKMSSRQTQLLELCNLSNTDPGSIGVKSLFDNKNQWLIKKKIPQVVIPLLANQSLTSMLIQKRLQGDSELCIQTKEEFPS